MEWMYKLDDPLLETLGACLAVFVLIIVVARIIGLRSFAKFTAYDFAFTVAIGSIIGSILTSATSVVLGFTAIFGLLIITYVISYLQKRYNSLDKLISNKPLLLMDGSEILYHNLKSAQIQEEQLIAKLRESNVLNLNQIMAVVLETTGDISVMHRTSLSENEKFEEKMLQGVSDQGRRKPGPDSNS